MSDKPERKQYENRMEDDENRMMNVHLVVVIVSTLGGASLIVEGMLLGWEFWVFPLLAVGGIALWVMYILQPFTEQMREALYLVYIMFCAFFHGAHSSSLFDISLMAALIMITLTGFEKKRYQDYIIIEYAIIMCMQLYMVFRDGGLSTDVLTVSRLLLHISSVFILYRICRNMVEQRERAAKRIEGFIDNVNKTNESMEDFLANISHEFRTPINVVTGMSSLLMKDNDDDRIEAINDAGLRLADQVGDILDYNEIMGKRLFITNEKYSTATLIGELVQSAGAMALKKHLELVVDMDPGVPSVMTGDVLRIKKIFAHLISNALKFTEKGGIYVRISCVERGYGVNLDIEVTDTGKGMSKEELSALSGILYQADKGRDRSTGGIGLGLTIVYGFAHAMNGFVKLDSTEGRGTTVCVSIPQTVDDHSPCLKLERDIKRCIAVYIKTEKYRIPEIRDFYQRMVENLSRGLKAPIHSVNSLNNLKSICDRFDVTHLFMGQEEFDEDRAYFGELSQKMCIVVNSAESRGVRRDGNIIHIEKPLYGIPIVNIVNYGDAYTDPGAGSMELSPVFDGVRALIVDDEVMNLVVASGLFREYGMITDTADSGREAIDKYSGNDYDVIFMDHMMPGMDGVEAMKKLKEIGRSRGGRIPIVVALTANAVSGAKEMFLAEGFDGFIAKPIEMNEFVRVMRRVLPSSLVRSGSAGGTGA